MNFKILHKTPTSEIHIQSSLRIVNSKDLYQYEDTFYFNNLCREGCINYNKKWSCPPYSPSFLSYSNDFNICLLILMSCPLSQFNYVKTEYMKVKTSNSILKSQSNRLSKFLENELSGKMLSNGSCRLCKPCSKKVSSGDCKHPEQIRFSLESLGLNVQSISQDFFSHDLQWYQSKLCPEYSTVMSGVLTNNILGQHDIKELIEKYCSMNSISYTSIDLET